jgi:uncharacterized protein
MKNMNLSSHLFQLQKFDLEIERINLRLVEIQKILESNEELQRAEEELKASKQQTIMSQHALRTIEEEVHLIQMKREQTEATLYSDRIRNPKELQDLEREIVSLKKRISSLEDHQLEAMLQLEQAETIQKECIDRLTKIQEEQVIKTASLRGEQSQLIQKIERLKLERQATEASVDSKSLEVYNQLRIQKHGRAVATIVDTSCSACGATLRPAEIQLAHSSVDMAYCESCGRILFTR